MKICLNCNKELFSKIGVVRNKKFCNKGCYDIYEKSHYTRKKVIPISKDILEDLYLNKKMSFSQIAKEYETSLKQIGRFLKWYGIPARPFSTKGLNPSLGTKRSLETRIKISESKKGENSSTWKGGVTPIHKKIRQTLELKLWRKAVLERDNKTCQMCGVRKEKGMEVDHIKPFALYPELRTSIENGRVLCNPCHRQTDSYGMRTTKLTQR